MYKKFKPFIISGTITLISLIFFNATRFKKAFFLDNKTSLNEQTVTAPSISDNSIKNNTSGIRINNLCTDNPDERIVMWGNVIVEIKNGELNQTNGNKAYCIMKGIEPRIYELTGSCSGGTIVFNNDDVNTNCKEFEPITFNCKIYNDGYDFTIQQTNLSHFSTNINGVLNRINFEKNNSTIDSSNNILIGIDEIKNFTNDSELKNQIERFEILRNPYGMGFAACNYFATKNGISSNGNRFSSNNCQWKNPSAPECYGKYDLNLFDKEFYHPAYHGPREGVLPGYQGNLSFDISQQGQQDPNLETNGDPIDGVNDGWATFEIMPLNIYSYDEYPAKHHYFGKRAYITIPYQKNIQFNNLLSDYPNTSDRDSLSDKTKNAIIGAADVLKCIHRGNDATDCPVDLQSPKIRYEKTLKRDFIGYGGVTSDRVQKILMKINGPENIINRDNLCKDDNAPNNGGCKNLIITDYETCSNEYQNIPSNTEIACLPKYLEIFHNQLNDENQEIDIFTITGFDNVHVKNLAIKIIPNGIRGQIWKSYRILKTLGLNNNEFTCNGSYDNNINLTYQGTGNCFNANNICLDDINNTSIDNDQKIKNCKNRISKELLRNISFRHHPNNNIVFGKYNYIQTYGVWEYTSNKLDNNFLNTLGINDSSYSDYDKMLLNNIMGIFHNKFKTKNDAKRPLYNIFNSLSYSTIGNNPQMKCGDDLVNSNFQSNYLSNISSSSFSNYPQILKSIMDNCPSQFYYTIVRLLSDTFDPQENISSFNAVFRTYDNSNVTFSNVIVRASAFDGHIYSTADQKLTIDGVKLEGISGVELRDHHIPLDDPEVGLTRLNQPWSIDNDSDFGHMMPGRFLETLFFMSIGIKVDNGRDIASYEIEYPYPAARYSDYTNPENYLPSGTICKSVSGNEISECKSNDSYLTYRQDETITNEQLLSPFYESNHGPEKFKEENANFNYFDGSTHFNDLKFQNRESCRYQEAKSLYGDNVHEKWKYFETYKAYIELNSCTKNSYCSAVGGGDGVCMCGDQYCTYGRCTTSACDNDYTVIINSTVQNDTYNGNYADSNFANTFLNDDWSMDYDNSDGLYLQSTSALVYNNNVRNIMGDTLYDFQHRDRSNRSPNSFDHLMVERNLFSLGMTKNTSSGAPEDTTLYSNNIYLSSNVGGYWQTYRPFWIHNTFIQPDKVTNWATNNSIQTDPDSYAKATYRLFHIIDGWCDTENDPGCEIRRWYDEANAPYTGPRMNLFNNSVLSATKRFGHIFFDKVPFANPSGIRFTTGGNLIHATFSETAKVNGKNGHNTTRDFIQNTPPLTDSYLSRTDFISKYCYGEDINVFDHIRTNDSCKNYSLEQGCMNEDHRLDFRCFIGGHENQIVNKDDAFFPLFNQIPFVDVDEAQEIIDAADPFANSFRGVDKCNNYNDIHEDHLNYAAPAFHSMSGKYRVHRDFNGRNRYVKTTPGAFEKGNLGINGCRQ